MRFLHTADWHLGRTLSGFDMLEDQAYTLESLADIAAGAGLDAIVVAGDVYDRSVPPEDAIRVFSDVLVRLRKIAPVLVIAGNHDSGGRIDFARTLLRGAGVHLAGTARNGIERVDLPDHHGTVAFHLMPFATPEEACHETSRDDLRTHQEATAARIERVDFTGTTRHVLVGHLFAQGGIETQASERDISVGGAAVVDPSLFSPFCYTALGHLHRPHDVGSERVRYSGSPCRYSFAEENHHKSVSVVEIDSSGRVVVEEVKLSQRRGMRTLRDTFERLLHGAANDEHRGRDLIRVELLDTLVVPGAAERLRGIYPHLLEFNVSQSVTNAGGEAPAMADLRACSPHDFVRRFLADRYASNVNDSIVALARSCMERAIGRDEA